MDYKKCAHCGEIRPIKLFRKYYNRPGRYAFCKMCEQIETRRKHLDKKVSRSTDEQVELDNINKLYEQQIKAGLRANRKSRVDTAAEVSRQLKAGRCDEV